MTTDPAPSRPAACPRCGYDQRGVIESWADACPLTGICSECGLEFEWGMILDPVAFAPRWCVEFAEWGHRVRTSLRTALWSFRPHRFWSELWMLHPIRGRPLVAYATVMLALLGVIYLVVQTSVAARVRYLAGQQMAQLRVAPGEMEDAVQEQIDFFLTIDPADPMVQNRLTVLRQRLAELKEGVEIPHGVTLSYPRVIVESIIRPLGRASAGEMRDFWQSQPYPAPIRIHRTFAGWEQSTFSSMRYWYLAVYWPKIVNATILSLFVTLMTPVAFVLFPFTVIQRRVRLTHFVRIGVYSLIVPVGVFVLSLLLVAASLPDSGFRVTLVNMATWNCQYGVAVLLGVWWGCAIRYYLKWSVAWPLATALILLVVLLNVWFIFGASILIP